MINHITLLETFLITLAFQRIERDSHRGPHTSGQSVTQWQDSTDRTARTGLRGLDCADQTARTEMTRDEMGKRHVDPENSTEPPKWLNVLILEKWTSKKEAYIN